jgi:lactoylglutathione lyase
MGKDTKDHPNVKEAVPFFRVLDMGKSLRFYKDVLGFEIKMSWEPNGKIEWCWLRLGNASLMLQEYRDNAPAVKRGVGVSIYFICEDALKIYKQALLHGVSIAEPFVGNNLWVVELRDPDDYLILFESATDVAEGTKYANWRQ